MKKVSIVAVILLLGVSTLSAMIFRPATPDPAELWVKKRTILQLQDDFGDKINLPQGMELSDVEDIHFMEVGNPCNNSEFGLCGPVAAQARIYARNIANNCCCVITFGYECCDPSTGGEIAVLFRQEPTHPCN